MFLQDAAKVVVCSQAWGAADRERNPRLTLLWCASGLHSEPEAYSRNAGLLSGRLRDNAAGAFRQEEKGTGISAPVKREGATSTWHSESAFRLAVISNHCRWRAVIRRVFGQLARGAFV